MANRNYLDLEIKVDNASATLTDLTNWITSVEQSGAQTNNSDAGLNTEEDTLLPGLATGALTLAGFINSTTSPIWGPLVGNRTSITKTVQVYDGVKYRYGEYYPTNVRISGSVNTVPTWSADLQLTGAVNTTSVTQS